MTSLAARDKELEMSTLRTFCSCFPLILKLPVPEYVHEIVIGLPIWREDIAGFPFPVSCDSHVTNRKSSQEIIAITAESVGGENELKSLKFSISKNLQSKVDALSEIISNTDENLSKEFLNYFNDGVLWILEK